MELNEPFKGDPLESANEHMCHDNNIRHHIASLRLEVADVSVRGPLTVEGLQGWNFEFGGI